MFHRIDSPAVIEFRYSTSTHCSWDFLHVVIDVLFLPFVEFFFFFFGVSKWRKKKQCVMCPEYNQTAVVPILIPPENCLPEPNDALLNGYIFEFFPWWQNLSRRFRLILSHTAHGSRPVMHSVASWRVAVIQNRLAKYSELGLSEVFGITSGDFEIERWV